MERTTSGYKSGLVMLAVAAVAGAWVGAGPQTDAARVTELLDQLIQPRFQKDGGVFGMRRVVKSPGHEEVGALTDQSAWDRQQLDRIQASKHDYRVSMLQLKHPPGHYRKGQRPLWGSDAAVVRSKSARARPDPGPTLLPMIGADYDRASYDGIQAAALAALPQMNREGTATTTVNSWRVTLRPVRASKQSCVGCHRGAKQGDTLGVLVYAVNRKPTPGRSAGPKTRQPAKPVVRGVELAKGSGPLGHSGSL